MIDVSIVIPVYNEAENIIETLTNIENKLLFAHEILIVYDMDNDNTLPVVKSFPPQASLMARISPSRSSHFFSKRRSVNNANIKLERFGKQLVHTVKLGTSARQKHLRRGNVGNKLRRSALKHNLRRGGNLRQKRL